MLPRLRRIPKNEFQYIVSKGKRYNSSHLLLYVAPFLNGSNGLSRFAFSASKKVSNSAVKRNRLRRQGYSVLKDRLKHLKNGSFLFFFYKGNGNLEYKQIESEVLELLSASSMLL